MITRDGSKWLVKDSEGKRTLGRHDSKKKALNQLRAIEANKYADGGVSPVNDAQSMSPILKESYSSDKKRFKKLRNKILGRK